MARKLLSDELTLQWVELRVAGQTSLEIAEKFGASTATIRTVTNRVIEADAKHHDDRIEFPTTPNWRKK